jgi:hypothetical protein
LAFSWDFQRTIDAFERQRSRNAHLARPFTLIGIPAIVVGVIGYLAGFPVLAWVLFAVAAFLLVRYLVTSRSEMGSFKDTILPLLVAEIDKDLRYDAKGITVDEFVSSGLFEKPDEFESQDAVHGAVGGIPIRFALVRAAELTKTGDYSHDREPIFDGVLLVAEVNRHFAGATQVLLGGATAVDSWSDTDVALDDPRFNAEFHVRSTDDAEARDVLTPTMIGLIFRLKKRFGGVQLQFAANRVWIAVPADYSLFGSKLDTRHDMAEVTRIFAHLSAITDVVQHLPLDTWNSTSSATNPASKPATTPAASVHQPISLASPAARFSDPYGALLKALLFVTPLVALGVGAVTVYLAAGSIRAGIHGEVGMGGMVILVGVFLIAIVLFSLVAAWPMHRAKKRNSDGLVLLAAINVVAIIGILIGVALPILAAR